MSNDELTPEQKERRARVEAALARAEQSRERSERLRAECTRRVREMGEEREAFVREVLARREGLKP